MKTVLAVAIIALMTVAAYSQGMGGGKRRHAHDQNSGESKKKKANERPYKSPLESLPDKKFDPWQSMRTTEPNTNTKPPN